MEMGKLIAAGFKDGVEAKDNFGFIVIGPRHDEGIHEGGGIFERSHPYFVVQAFGQAQAELVYVAALVSYGVLDVGWMFTVRGLRRNGHLGVDSIDF
jgi:Zn-dependent metalloprotease